MELFKVRFCIKLGLMIATTYFILSYVVKPIRNHCRMTFMMEPPRFIRIPIDENLIISGQQKISSQKYKLYMYSEFGFPLEVDMRRDLKDSMPVLFIPGNAGSYQQVRSLASTCIRHQLQSLDAYKFIFYTIDFHAQLSGISGELIEKQIDFVHAALNQISILHPTDTNGVIVIGHSVGGFLSKALFTRLNFDQNLVAMLINLASPLTQPYMNFDYKMQEIYTSANDFWAKNSHKFNAVSISISGGQSDKLVPVHSSLDPNYDLSLTTSSIRDVWLTTDHVCITWCRELMHKLASLLSQVMDKQNTKLIADKNVVIKRVIETLISPISDTPNELLDTQSQPSKQIKKLIKLDNIRLLKSSYISNRNELMSESIVLNLTESKSDSIFIWLEYIDKIKDYGLSGCSNIELNENNSHILCTRQVNLLSIATKLPSRLYEPKKQFISFKTIQESFAQINYLLIDFTSSNPHIEDKKSNKVPENLQIYRRNALEAKSIYFPTMIEYYFNKISNHNKQFIKIEGDKNKSTMLYLKYKLDNLKYATQFYKVEIESRNCASIDGSPRETLVLLMQGQFMKENFHPEKGETNVIVEINSQESMKIRKISEINNDLSMKIFVDGSCENTITLTFDWFSLFEKLIQKHLSKILTFCCYFSYTSIVWHSFKLLIPSIELLSYKMNIFIWILWFISNAIIYAYLIDNPNSNIISINYLISNTDYVIQFFLIILASSGISSSVEYFVNRIVDIATIINNVQMKLSTEINSFNGAKIGQNSPRNGYANGNSNNHIIRKQQSFLIDFNLMIVCFAICGSLIFSEILMSICMLLLLIKTQLNLTTKLSVEITIENHQRQQYNVNRLTILQNIILGTASLCALGFLANIPAALIMLNNPHNFNDFISNLIGKQIDSYFIVTLISTIMIYQSNILIESMSRDKIVSQIKTITFIRNLPIKVLHLVAVLPMLGIDGNMRNINLVQLIMTIWLMCMLRESRNKLKLKTE